MFLLLLVVELLIVMLLSTVLLSTVLLLTVFLLINLATLLRRLADMLLFAEVEVLIGERVKGVSCPATVSRICSSTRATLDFLPVLIGARGAILLVD